MRKPSGPIGFMCGTEVEDGVFAAVVAWRLYSAYGYNNTLASYYLCQDPATIVRIFPVTQLHGGDEGGGCVPEHLPRGPLPGQGGPDLVVR